MDGTGAEHRAERRAGLADTVRIRRVFYIPGYDPFPPRRYRELYRREAAAQAAISGHRLTLTPATDGWQVSAVVEGAAVETRVEVLVWSDLVQASMGAGIVETYLQLMRTVWVYLRSGALPRLMRLRRGPIVAAFYPVVMLLAQLVLVGLVAGLVAWFAGVLVGLAVLPLGLVAFRRLDHRLYAYYLMHDFAYAAQGGGTCPPLLKARLAAFRTRIAEALVGDVDEVLVVGHSSGAHLAVSVLAGILRDGPPGRRATLGLLTLGQVVPMVSFLPQADWLRRDLRDMAAQDTVAWIDVTAPGDPACFALCDPVAVTGVAPSNARWPLVVSAAYSLTLDPARLRALRWRFFRRHIQYLCAFDRPETYDYFAITAGPRTLAGRFAGRRPSPGRIGRALSPHRGLSA